MATAAQSENRIEIGRTISRGFEAIGHHLPAYALVALLLAGLPGFLATYLFLGEWSDAGDFGAFGSLSYLATLFLSMLTGALMQAIIMRSAILTLSGRPADIGASVAGAFRLILPLVGLSILTSLMIGIGLILLIVPGIIAWVALSVSVPVLVEEGRSVTESMERSADLTKGSRWRIFLLLLIFTFAYILLAAFVGGGAIALGWENGLLQAGADAIIAALSGLLMAAMIAGLYVELRTVKEGATAETLASIFE